MTRLKDLLVEQLKDPEFSAEYDALEEEFGLASAMIAARSRAEMTQSEVAAKMNTSQSYVARLESGKVNPTIPALKRYAAATGSHVKISFERH